MPKPAPRLKHRLSASGFARVSRILADAAREFLVPMARVTPTDIEDWIGRQKWAPATRYRVAAALSVAWREAIREGVATANPAKGLHLGRVERRDVPYLTGEQLAALIAAMPERIAPHVTFLAHTGLRRSELLGLRWQDVSPDMGRISVLSGKTGTVRHVPLTDAASAVLAARKHLDTPFADIEGHELTRLFVRAASRVGLEMSPHDLRHVYASSLVRAGVPIPMVARLLGHSTPVLTLTTYGRHAPDDAERDAVSRLQRAWNARPSHSA